MTKPNIPCKMCGGPKGPGRGRKICGSCEERRRPELQEKKRRRDAERAAKKRAERGPGSRKLASDAPAGQKWCAHCQQYLPFEQFGARADRKKFAPYCRPCSSDYAHARSLVRYFDMSVDRYNELFDLQGGRCAICEQRPRTRRLAVDHDHKTGEIRGLLCTRCNHKLLGAAHESQAMLRRAARYLDHPPAATGSPVPAPEHELTELVLESALNEANSNANAAHGIAWLKRRGKTSPLHGYVVMDGHTFIELLKEAGYGD